MLKLNRFWMSTLAFSLACSVMGGLREREQEVKERSDKKREEEAAQPVPPRNDSTRSSRFGSGTFPASGSSNGFMSDFWSWLVIAPFAYRTDDPAASMRGEDGAEWAEDAHSIFPKHDLGQATAPYARFDYNYQWADQVTAHDGRIEAGYKLIAFQGRFTRYEDSLGDTLDLDQYYLMLRYGGYRPNFVPGHFEFNLGFGAAQHKGLDRYTSGAFTFGLKYYPVEWFGAEFRPAFYRWDEIFIRDYDFSISAGGRFIQLRGGYRWMWDQGVVDVQSGPYAGLSLSF